MTKRSPEDPANPGHADSERPETPPSAVGGEGSGGANGNTTSGVDGDAEHGASLQTHLRAARDEFESQVALAREQFEQTNERIKERTGGRPTFITFDMDFVDPASAPGVQTPEAGGPTTRETLQLLRALNGINLVGCDVTEISPMYEGPGQITSLLGATVLCEFISLLASERAKLKA